MDAESAWLKVVEQKAQMRDKDEIFTSLLGVSWRSRLESLSRVSNLKTSVSKPLSKIGAVNLHTGLGEDERLIEEVKEAVGIFIWGSEEWGIAPFEERYSYIPDKVNNELRSLEGKVKIHYSGILSWREHDVVLTGENGQEVIMGEYQVNVAPTLEGGCTVQVMSLGGQEREGDTPHPHVSSEETLCMGEGEVVLNNVLETAELTSIPDIVSDLLRQYDSKDAYWTLEVKDVECDCCGDCANEDDLVMIDYPPRMVCQDCRVDLPSGDRTDRESFLICEDCEEPLCLESRRPCDLPCNLGYQTLCLECATDALKEVIEEAGLNKDNPLKGRSIAQATQLIAPYLPEDSSPEQARELLDILF